MSSIIYLGNFFFPDGNAAGKRVHANGKLFRDLGYEVTFIGMNKNSSSCDSIVSTKKKYDGFEYYELPYPRTNLDWLKFNQTFKKIVNFIESEGLLENLSAIVYYGSPSLSFFNNKIIKYCKKKNIKVIADCVDWLTAKTNSFSFNLIKNFDNTYQKAYANNKADGVIVISSFLESYYKKNGAKTLILPPLASEYYTDELKRGNNQNQRIICYAGIPFRKGQELKNPSLLKDRIDLTIELLYVAKRNNYNFIFNIYGFTKEEYLTVLPKQRRYVENLGNNIQFHGLKDNYEVIKNIAKADFSMLYRDVNRDTTAGFPTKISESLNLGTPVITTNTSDLKKYIIEGKNGFFLDMEDKLCRQKQFEEILGLDGESILRMKKFCIENKIFHYKQFQKITREFFVDINLN